MGDLTNYFKELKIITEYELTKQIKTSWKLYKKGQHYETRASKK